MNAMLRRARQKRGIVLLVVISLLTLFILLGVTYTLVATQYRDAARHESYRDLYRDNPETEMELVLGQLLYGSLVRTSLLGHDLLGDMYGNDGVAAKVDAATPATPPAGSGMVTLDLDPTAVLQPFQRTLSDRLEYYTGRVLTFTTGPAKGVSTRIMHYVPSVSGAPPRVVVETTDGIAPGNLIGSQVLINGAPFNGTGIGYNESTRKLDMHDGTPDNLVALMPHFAQYLTTPQFVGPSTVPQMCVNYGGEDESWDAPDYQNMFLAMVPPSALELNTDGSPDNDVPILPSFHRPELVRYWANHSNGLFSTSNPSYRDFRRQIIMRPMPWDHPNFSGSNPYIPAASNPASLTQAEDDAWVAALTSTHYWDVDNDNDGLPDSIWIDPGLPVLTSPDGRRYKRLVAILVKDLDGRINLNTAGNLKVAQENNFYQANTDIPANTLAGRDPSNPGTVRVPRGLGYGPETDILRLLVRGGDTSNYQSFITMRYGRDGRPGVPNLDDQAANLPFKALGLPSNYITTSSIYASPPDVWGRAAVALNYYGQPIFTNNVGTDETLDDPYEMQVDHRTAHRDSPYTPAELERLLRYNDADAPMIQSRLNVSPLNSSPRARESVTTAAWHVTGPSMITPKELRTTSSTNPPLQGSILDLYSRKGVPDSEWRNIIPFEFLHGEPFNLNRPFGDGVDINGNGVVDEPWESEPTDFTNGSSFGIDNPATNGNAVRQMYARHLYCLAMLLKNPNYEYDLDGDGTATPAETAKALAQWAINVVDFRDSDSISTPFEYDPNPFDGWDLAADGIPDAAYPYIVWGVERPELLISEAIAWHDRRTEDTDEDEPERKKTDDADDPDEDYDQRLRPTGALFVELYNPWVDQNNIAPFVNRPSELYLNTEGVVLNAAPGGSPVWRLVIDRRSAAARAGNPDEPRPETLTGPADGSGHIERSIYFTNPVGATAAGGEVFHTDLPIAPLKPGRYAIVGSAGKEEAGTYTTYVGRIRGQSDLPGMDPLIMADTRQIRLQPNVNPDVHQVQILNNGNAYDVNVANDIQPAIAVPINRPRSVSITEPIGGYTNTGFVAPTDPASLPDGAGTYTPPLDEPLDKNRPGFEFLMEDGTAANFRTIHLQRLANPLLPHDRYTNPYITIDSTPIDVTAFNGVTSPSDPEADAGKHTNFQTFQRGGSFPDSEVPGYNAPDPAIPNPASPLRNLWRREPARSEPIASSPPGVGTEHYFNYQLFHTLGYLNRQYHPYFTAASPVPLIYRGAPSFMTAAGTPGPAFPWLTFNNRPFTNAMELLLVPRRSQYDLLTYFGVKVPASNPHPYVNSEQNLQFPHLLNLMQAADNATVDSGMQLGPQLNRLLEYVGVPSPFVDTERWYPTTSFTEATAPAPSPAETYRPPFSSLSRHREPGKVNINTIFDEYVFNSAVAGIPEGAGLQSTWLNVQLSRQGYGTTASDVFAPNANYPSYFSQPFRAADAADLMPLPSLWTESVHATLLRKRPGSNEPLFGNTDTSEHVNVDRNPYFAFQGLQKIGNTFTTHSNVFAVWMTVGYFEVTEWGAVDAGHPDGYQLGMELGADTGEIQRHRAFFIIDRSIPVAYQPGQKHNTDRTVLLRRYIE